MALLLKDLRSYLVGEGVVRVPSVAGPAPPLWLEPKHGTPAPGEGNNPTERGTDAVLAAFREGGPPARSYESFLRTDLVDLRIRTTTATRADELEIALRAALIDKRGWTMGTRTVVESGQLSGLDRLAADEQSFTYQVVYWFQTYAAQAA